MTNQPYHLTEVTPEDRSNYPHALRVELEKIKKANLSFRVSNWLTNKIYQNDIRLMKGFVPLKEGVYESAFSWHKGLSPKESREKKDSKYTYCSLLQFLRLIQEYPEICKERLLFHLTADELRVDADDRAIVPFCFGSEDGLWLDGYWYDDALSYYAACAFLNKPNL